MNKWNGIGRLTRDVDGNTERGYARFTLAVNRRVRRNADNDQPTADFISCVYFGDADRIARLIGENGQPGLLKKGTKIGVSGRIQTGSYTNKDGQKIYTTDVVVEEWEFVEPKDSSEKTSQVQQPAATNHAASSEQPAVTAQPAQDDDDAFMKMPEGDEDPFGGIDFDL